MSKNNKTFADKEKELLNTIIEAKKKLEKLQQKQKLDLGNLALKHNLHLIDVKKLDLEFKNLAEKLCHES